jgi:hypothetical protein
MYKLDPPRLLGITTQSHGNWGWCSVFRNGKRCQKSNELSAKILDLGPSDRYAVVADHIENFHPLLEKFRVVLMTITDGVMSSQTLFEFGCSKSVIS